MDVLHSHAIALQQQLSHALGVARVGSALSHKVPYDVHLPVGPRPQEHRRRLPCLPVSDGHHPMDSRPDHAPRRQLQQLSRHDDDVPAVPGDLSSSPVVVVVVPAGRELRPCPCRPVKDLQSQDGGRGNNGEERGVRVSSKDLLGGRVFGHGVVVEGGLATHAVQTHAHGRVELFIVVVVIVMS